MKLRSLGLLAVVALIVASCGGAAPDAAGPNEGIQVHGDWTIDVYNPDGSLDQHREFSNEMTSGAVALSLLLGGELAAGAGNRPYVSDWSIGFGVGTPAPESVSPCDTAISFSDNPDFNFGCAIAPATVTRGADSDSLTLSGSAQVTQDGSINWVETLVGGGGAGGSSGGLWFTSFTGTQITEQSVSAGQTVQVEVEISFTSG